VGEQFLSGGTTRESVNEFECDGWWLLRTESARVKNDAFLISWAGCVDEGANRNSVGYGDGIGFEGRRMVDWSKYSGDFELVGENGWTLATVVGVGGYECTLVVELEALALSCNVLWESMAGGRSGAKDTFVRVFKDSAASV